MATAECVGRLKLGFWLTTKVLMILESWTERQNPAGPVRDAEPLAAGYWTSSFTNDWIN
jgi:hypothetical protein